MIMNPKTKITIVASPELSAMLLDELAGRTGVVTETLCDEERSNKGCMVLLDAPFQEEHQWFIPISSLRHA